MMSYTCHGGGKGGGIHAGLSVERVQNPLKLFVGGVHSYLKGDGMKIYLVNTLGHAGVVSCFVTRE